MALLDLTTEEKRRIRAYNPTLSNRTGNGVFDLVTQLQALINEHQAVQTKTGTIPAGDAFIDIEFDSVPTTAKVLATMNAAGGSATHLISAIRQTSTTVRVTANAAPGGSDTATVTAMIDLR